MTLSARRGERLSHRGFTVFKTYSRESTDRWRVEKSDIYMWRGHVNIITCNDLECYAEDVSFM